MAVRISENILTDIKAKGNTKDLFVYLRVKYTVDAPKTIIIHVAIVTIKTQHY